MNLLQHHLGLPPCAEMEPRLSSLANSTRAWYRKHGTPWEQSTWSDIRSIEGDSVWLADGVELRSPRLARGFEDAEAHAVVVAAFSAGARVDGEIDRRWKDDRPDKAMFLHAYAVAVCEHLRANAATRLRQSSGFTVLPHYSPGYEGWPLSEQATLFSLVSGSPLAGWESAGGAEHGPLRVLPSGGLWPARSTIAAFGITQRKNVDVCLEDFWCDQRLPSAAHGGRPPTGDGRGADYTFPERALSKWSRERLSIAKQPGGRLDARFRFDGTTCSSLGMPLAFNFDVELAVDECVDKAAGGYRVVTCRCEPAEGDTGHRAMCASRSQPRSFLTSLRAVGELLRGRLLEEAIRWSPAGSPGGCMCLRSDQNHKWSMVFQTLHYKLVGSSNER
jgi:hypothetical protein